MDVRKGNNVKEEVAHSGQCGLDKVKEGESDTLWELSHPSQLRLQTVP